MKFAALGTVLVFRDAAGKAVDEAAVKNPFNIPREGEGVMLRRNGGITSYRVTQVLWDYRLDEEDNLCFVNVIVTPRSSEDDGEE